MQERYFKTVLNTLVHLLDVPQELAGLDRAAQVHTLGERYAAAADLQYLAEQASEDDLCCLGTVIFWANSEPLYGEREVFGACSPCGGFEFLITRSGGVRLLAADRDSGSSMSLSAELDEGEWIVNVIEDQAVRPDQLSFVQALLSRLPGGAALREGQLANLDREVQVA